MRIFSNFLVIRRFATQIHSVRTKRLKNWPSKLIEQGKGGRERMNNLISKLDMMLINAKCKFMAKKEASDQLIVMFIIIAVAAGIAGLLYIFATKTLLPNFEGKLTNLINGWFSHS